MLILPSLWELATLKSNPTIYYQIIVGIRYDRILLDAAEAFA
jgi:hypothetical protein